MSRRKSDRNSSYRCLEKRRVRNERDSLDGKEDQNHRPSRKNCRLTTHVFLLQIEGEMTDLQMFQFVFMKIRPTPNPSVDNMRKTFTTGDLIDSIDVDPICSRSTYLQSAIQRALNRHTFSRDLSARRNRGDQCVQFVFFIFQFFHQTEERKIRAESICVRLHSFRYLSIARLAKVSLSPFVRCRWQSRVDTIPLHASDDEPFALEEDAPVNGGLCE